MRFRPATAIYEVIADTPFCYRVMRTWRGPDVAHVSVERDAVWHPIADVASPGSYLLVVFECEPASVDGTLATFPCEPYLDHGEDIGVELDFLEHHKTFSRSDLLQVLLDWAWANESTVDTLARLARADREADVDDWVVLHDSRDPRYWPTPDTVWSFTDELLGSLHGLFFAAVVCPESTRDTMERFRREMLPGLRDLLEGSPPGPEPGQKDMEEAIWRLEYEIGRHHPECALRRER